MTFQKLNSRYMSFNILYIFSSTCQLVCTYQPYQIKCGLSHPAVVKLLPVKFSTEYGKFIYKI